MEDELLDHCLKAVIIYSIKNKISSRQAVNDFILFLQKCCNDS